MRVRFSIRAVCAMRETKNDNKTTGDVTYYCHYARFGRLLQHKNSYWNCHHRWFENWSSSDYTSYGQCFFHSRYSVSQWKKVFTELTHLGNSENVPFYRAYFDHKIFVGGGRPADNLENADIRCLLLI